MPPHPIPTHKKQSTHPQILGMNNRTIYGLPLQVEPQAQLQPQILAARNDSLWIVANEILPGVNSGYSAVFPEPTPASPNHKYICAWDTGLTRFTLEVNSRGDVIFTTPLDDPKARDMLAATSRTPANTIEDFLNIASPRPYTLYTQVGRHYDPILNVTLRSTGPTREAKHLIFVVYGLEYLMTFLDIFLQADGAISLKYSRYIDNPALFLAQKRALPTER